MKASLRLEFIGCNSSDQLRQFSRIFEPGSSREDYAKLGPSVVRISVGTDGVVTRCEVFGKRDYSRANSKGSRGVYVNYVLEENELYAVTAPYSWRGVERYFAAVTPSGSIYKLTADEVSEWLSAI